MLRDATKRELARLGRVMPDRALYELNGVVNYLEAGAWMRRRGLAVERRGYTKFGVFDQISRVVADEPVLYVEFGVADGGSMRYWSQMLRHPGAKLHGFDSFEGLPTDWILNRPAGHFAQAGRPPEIDDPRITFFAGWFDETLPDYDWPVGERLVLNCDADLYSSTVTALSAAEPHIRAGTFIYFDEFNHRADEMRAFGEYLDRTGIRVELFAASDDLAHVALRLL